MKIKRRKSIMIGSVKFKISWDKKSSGGSFDVEKRKMTIGTDLGVTSEWEVLMHEISEAIHLIYGTSFYDSANASFLFVMNHKEFQNHNMILSQTMLQFLK